MTNKVARGRAATSAEAVSEPPTDSISGWNVAEKTTDSMTTGSSGALRRGALAR
jgi:hypothetical protein